MTSAPSTEKTNGSAPIVSLPIGTCVWVLAPLLETSDPNLDYYYDFTQSKAEYTKAFQELGINNWQWQSVTVRNYREVLERIAVTRHEGSYPLIVNLCDGDGMNDIPGIEVIHYLEELGLAYTGADEAFYDITTSKIVMKRAFDAAGVPTPQWEVVGEDCAEHAAAIMQRLGSPLIVKPAISAGSMGVGIKSVVKTADELIEQVQRLYKGYRGWELTGGGVYVEQFIAGCEYTTFIVGSGELSYVYPPVERVFHDKLPDTEQFLSFDRLWEIYEDEAPIGDYEALWNYGVPLEHLIPQIVHISKAAYVAVGGRGYGRIDLRMDKVSGKLYVLEVNAQCGLSEDENYTSIGAILRFAQTPFSHVVAEILTSALRQQQETLHSIH